MNASIRLAMLIVMSTAAGFARGQTGMPTPTGTPDQSNPIYPLPGANTIFNTNQPTVWQQQVRAGLSGRLEGFVLQMGGPLGASIEVNVRMGSTWNTSPAAFHTIVAKPTVGVDDVFVDVTSANIQVVPGSLFVIEVNGQNTGANLFGSWVSPPGAPLYSEPLFQTGACFSDCGYGIGFTTYVELGTPTTAYCSGDGSGTACPCGNAGTSSNGCASTVSSTGAHLSSQGVASVLIDTFVLAGSDMPNSSALYFQGTQRTAGGAGTVFGDGLRCVGGTIIRLGSKTNSSGASTYPGGSDATISVKGANTAGVVRDYQCWYRNAAPFCTPSTFNLTNGLEVTWIP